MSKHIEYQFDMYMCDCVYTRGHSNMHMDCICICIYIYVYVAYMYMCMYMYVYMRSKLDLVRGILMHKNNAIVFHIRCLSLNMLFFVLFITCCICIKYFQFCVFIYLFVFTL